MLYNKILYKKIDFDIPVYDMCHFKDYDIHHIFNIFNF